MVEIIGETFDALGKILVAYMAIRVHGRFRKEHKVDNKVFDEMKRESSLGILGIGLIITAYLIKIASLL